MCLKAMADHLRAIGEIVSNRDLILYSLGGLDSTYNPFMSSSTMRTGSNYFDVFHNELLAYEMRLD